MATKPAPITLRSIPAAEAAEMHAGTPVMIRRDHASDTFYEPGTITSVTVRHADSHGNWITGREHEAPEPFGFQATVEASTTRGSTTTAYLFSEGMLDLLHPDSGPQGTRNRALVESPTYITLPADDNDPRAFSALSVPLHGHEVNLRLVIPEGNDDFERALREAIENAVAGVRIARLQHRPVADLRVTVSAPSTDYDKPGDVPVAFNILDADTIEYHRVHGSLTVGAIPYAQSQALLNAPLDPTA